jgi:hypothetical protein
MDHSYDAGLLDDRLRKDNTPTRADYLGASGVKNMNKLDSKYCLTMASSLDAEAAGTRGHSYLRKLLVEQAAKYRAAAASR